MATRRRLLGTVLTVATVTISGCTRPLEGADPVGEGGDGSGKGSDGGDDDVDGDSKRKPRSAAIEYELDIDRSDSLCLSETIETTVSVSNEGDREESYEYRVSLEHEHDIRLESETVTGSLAGSERRTHDLTFPLRRTGEVALVVDEDVVETFEVRSQRNSTSSNSPTGGERIGIGVDGEFDGIAENGSAYSSRN